MTRRLTQDDSKRLFDAEAEMLKAKADYDHAKSTRSRAIEHFRDVYLRKKRICDQIEKEVLPDLNPQPYSGTR